MPKFIQIVVFCKAASSECIFQGPKNIEVGRCYIGAEGSMSEKRVQVSAAKTWLAPSGTVNECC